MRRGITILEVLVAILILTVGLISTLEVIAGSARTSTRSDDRSLALMAARSKMEEILKEPVLQVGTDEGKGVDTSTDYDWTANIEQSSNPSLLLITILTENRNTHVTASLSALRRPDLQTPETTDETGATTTGTDTPAAGGGQL
ncbi:MAG: hypothetical protein K0Q72_1800 [Armatimonadetes bacterium]|jgi:type II secretion system protein I|nr:hypothetical protein [Armatimonadota bacterium]